MNNELIEKVIKTNNVSCPDITFTNPLLDRNVAKALSKSFLEMLTASKQSSNVNSNLRHTILKNMRKICKNEPENHMKIREDFTSVLSECYIENIKEFSEKTGTVDKQLDDFLVRRLNEFNYTSKYVSNHNSEVIQALLNLNPSNIEALSSNVINWNVDNKNLNILSNLWTSDSVNEDIYDEVSIKIKSEIEKTIIKIIHFILTNIDADIESLFVNDDILNQLVTKCSISCHCFQICSGVMNYIFITTNFDPRIQLFIPMFVKYVKQYCTKRTFSLLYPTHLNHIVLLLDFDENSLTGGLKSKYVDMVTNYIHNLFEKSENELIMLLSHFPQWFKIYFVVKEVT